MKLRIPGAQLHTAAGRKRMIALLAATIAGGQSDAFEPYPVNSNDTGTWTLDMDNNWWVSFDPQAEEVLDLRYRYHSAGALEALLPWLQFKLDARVVDPA